MERHNPGKERLIAPTDFTSPPLMRNIQEDLVPPSHFSSSVQSTGAQRVLQIPPTTAPPVSWINTGITSLPSGNPSGANPWLAISQAQQEILELRKENQRLMRLQADSIRGESSSNHLSDFRTSSTERNEHRLRWESEWRAEAEKHKAEAERFKGQVEALKETAESYREEIRDKDTILNRHSHEFEALREELSKLKTELGLIREELSLSSAQKEKISSQFERLSTESSEKITKLTREVERSKEESLEVARRADVGRSQAEAETKQQMLRLSEQLEETQKKQEVKLQQLNASHRAELNAARTANEELQDRLQSMTSEVLHLKSFLTEVSTERDGLKERLSQMGHAFEAQSTTLHSLRNYIGQLAPEKGEKERLKEAVEKLSKEKAALQTTTELLTVRLNSLNEILYLQEEKLVKKVSPDPLMKDDCESLRVVQLWRDKVFKLCIQLRTKDIELRQEKDKLISKVSSTEQQVQQEQHRATVLQHSLHDRMAELDLERVEKEALKEDLAKARKENVLLESQIRKAEAEVKALAEAVHRFSQTFDNKMAEMDGGKGKLNTLTHRITFAQRRVETIQALVLRKVALQKVEKACKQPEADDSLRNLQIENNLIREERDRLSQELKRSPELIEKALADLKQQHELRVRQQQQEVEQSWMELQQAVAGREEAEQSLQQVRAQLEQNKVDLEGLRRKLLNQQERSEHALQEKVSEMEGRCAEKLSEMEDQVNAARREHTKAVMTLRRFEREAARKEVEMKEDLESESTKRGVLDKNTPPVTLAQRGLRRDGARTHTTALQNAAASRKHPQPPPERSCSVGAEVQLVADERLLCVLEELHSLSAAVVNSSEDSAEEEEGQSDSMGPATGSPHS